MKILYMVRHAKSSWKHNVNDHKRPLKGRGKRDASLVSNYIKNNITPPQRIITSDANRAHSTALYFKEALGVSDKKFIKNHDLYDFGGQNVMVTIKSLKNKWHTVMIVGHNHAFTSIVNMLGNKYIENFPTCGFVMLQFDVDSWSDIKTGKTIKTIFPRDLQN